MINKKFCNLVLNFNALFIRKVNFMSNGVNNMVCNLGLCTNILINWQYILVNSVKNLKNIETTNKQSAPQFI